jgi:ATP-dependent RNA helicase DDX55/SPB4
VFLQPGREEDYVPFLAVRKTPVTPLVHPEIIVSQREADETAERIRTAVRADRAIHESAQRAFVSWVKSYSRHQASSIFRVKDIDWSDMGKAWGLLRLPRMPELKNWDGDRSLGVGLDFETYAFRDRTREEARKRKLHEQKENAKGNAEKHPMGQHSGKRAWSRISDAKDARDERKIRRRARRAHEKWEKMTAAEREEQRELGRLIDEVKRRRIEEDDAEEFKGFDD